MNKWKYMFVRIWKGKIEAIDDIEYPNPKKQLNWRAWLAQQGLEGWELVSEVSFKPYSVHATLKHQVFV